MTKIERAAFRKGVKFAAEVADQYNKTTTHRYRLGDCILAKLNVLPRGRRPRLNKDRLKASAGKDSKDD